MLCDNIHCCRDTQQRLSQPPFVIKFADVDDGLYHIAAFHFDRNGRVILTQCDSAHASFMTRRSYDSMEHEGYHVSAEVSLLALRPAKPCPGPRADGSLRNMPGISLRARYAMSGTDLANRATRFAGMGLWNSELVGGAGEVRYLPTRALYDAGY
eukprot:2749512-Rhodomonas_salina.2